MQCDSWKWVRTEPHSEVPRFWATNKQFCLGHLCFINHYSSIFSMNGLRVKAFQLRSLRKPFLPLGEDSLFSLTAPCTITWSYSSQRRGPGPCQQHRWRNPENAARLISPYLPHPSFEAHAHPRPHLSYTLMVLCQLSFTLSGFADSFIKNCNWSLPFATSCLLESTFTSNLILVFVSFNFFKRQPAWWVRARLISSDWTSWGFCWAPRDKEKNLNF